MKRWIVLLLVLALVLPGAALTTAQQDEPARLILATTTSTEDSGLLEFILPVFEEQFNADVDVIAVGTGQALELGCNGDADVVLVHARAREDAFVEEGCGTERYDVMYNDFVLVGPADDPAGIAELPSAVEAFLAIQASESLFVSRGDNSGTHSKELSIWAAAGLEGAPSGDWYIEAGQGMGDVLNMSNELFAYTLADRATYIALEAAGLDLAIVYEGDPILFNPYGVIPVNPARFPEINAELAQQFADWLTSVEAQTLIASFSLNDQQLFVPSSAAWLASQEAVLAVGEFEGVGDFSASGLVELINSAATETSVLRFAALSLPEDVELQVVLIEGTDPAAAPQGLDLVRWPA
ncbi:MAG: solute-binding protein [Anaerolineae bacterium]|nr:solute-binding protein [Anaerolineae bacterium]